jgi:hypothetical protein
MIILAKHAKSYGDLLSAILGAVQGVTATIGTISGDVSGRTVHVSDNQVSIANLSMQSQLDINRTNAQIAAAQIAAAEKQAETQKQMLLYGGAGLGALVFLGLILKR